MNSDITYDLIVLGGGPAGYAAAIRRWSIGQESSLPEMERRRHLLELGLHPFESPAEECGSLSGGLACR